jgi:hypothetical protein
VTFGAGSNVYTGLGASNPALPAIHIGSADRSLKGVYGGAIGGCYRWAGGRGAAHACGRSLQCADEACAPLPRPCRVRMEGCASYTQCTTTNNMGYELTFCPNSTMSLCVGAVAAVNGVAGASSGSGWVRTYTLSANTRYTLNGFATPSAAAEGFYGEWALLAWLLGRLLMPPPPLPDRQPTCGWACQ